MIVSKFLEQFAIHVLNFCIKTMYILLVYRKPVVLVWMLQSIKTMQSLQLTELTAGGTFVASPHRVSCLNLQVQYKCF